MIFLGTGTSEGVPRVSCLTKDPPTCRVCLSTQLSKDRSPNRRRNTSVLVRRPGPDGRVRNVVIDVGKFFWHSALEWFVKYRVPTLDAVVLTHAHADSAGGLDDLRDWTNNVQAAVPIYLREQDLDVISRTFYYLVDRDKSTSGGGISMLDFHVIDEQPFDVEGLCFIPLEVQHGRNLTALGFRIGDFVYISDASHIPDATAGLMQGAEVMVMDALRPRRTHGSHFTLEEALDQIRRFRPARALLTDMTHDYDHDETNAELARLKRTEGIDVQLAHDGLRVPVTLC
ncbi:MAG: MBL fold metallo-hydrolase [Chloroflexota bacterium]